MIRPLVSERVVGAQRVRVARSGSVFVGSTERRYMFDYGGTARTARPMHTVAAAAATAPATLSNALAATRATSAEQRSADASKGSLTRAELVQLVDDLGAAREVGLATERGLREEVARLRATHGVDAVRGETLALLRANEALRGAIATRSPLGARQNTDDAKRAARDVEVSVLCAQLAERTEALDAALSMNESQRVAIEALKLHIEVGDEVGDDAGDDAGAVLSPVTRRQYTERDTPPLSMSPIVRVSRDGTVYIQ